VSRALVAAAALALASAACTKSAVPAPGVRLRQPSAVASFVGRTIQDPVGFNPYIVVANAARHDLSIVDAKTNLAVPAFIKLQTLAIPFPDRPTLLVSAWLGDEFPSPTEAPTRANLLVAVASGGSILQVVETWSSANTVHSDPKETPQLAEDLGGDVLALVPMPFDPANTGRARIAALLSDRRIAVVEYRRGDDGVSIVFVSSTVSPPLPFEPLAIAAMPYDPAAPGTPTKLYVATRDPLAPGVFGVAEIAADLSNATAPGILDARGPTRLVATARLQERLPGAAASDGTAFAGQPRVPRVYAVLDESGCGVDRRIDCGVVALDPTVPAGTSPIPGDYAGLMPYRAPMRVPGHPLAIGTAGPPLAPPPSGELPDFSNGYMRIYMGKDIVRATTAVAAVPSDDGNVYFLDLGRFESATADTLLRYKNVSNVRGDYFSRTFNGQLDTKRLWIQFVTTDAQGHTTFNLAADTEGPLYVTSTPGFTPNDTFTVTYQGTLSPTLHQRAGEAGAVAPGQLWLALQVGDGPAGGTRILNQVVRLWDPKLAVRPNDILVLKAAAVPAPPAPLPACVGTRPLGTPVTTPDSEVEKEFELRVGDLLAPDPAKYPGGAVTLLAPSTAAPPAGNGDPAEWLDCYNALVAASALNNGANVVTGFTVTVRASDYVTTSSTLGYLGRPAQVVATDGTGTVGYTVSLAYPAPPANEDTLAAACPLADWDGALPAPACDATCRTSCETFILARKGRRIQNVSEDCNTDPLDQAACAVGVGGAPPRYPNPPYTFPVFNGPVIGFQYGVERKVNTQSTDAPLRDMTLIVQTSSGVLPLAGRGSNTSPFGANDAVPFDRSFWVPGAGYRFLVSYPADFVLDTSPSVTPVDAVVIK
jgi:hypothetical protein